MSLQITFVTETHPPEVNGVAMTVGRLVEGSLFPYTTLFRSDRKSVV
mgnify:CR=1 FL=1